ncbi:MAG: hypothetical protein GY774_34895 [Planctomycetes bacterium]|nr:hypothetical protein [Planctomycetota bacterium]
MREKEKRRTSYDIVLLAETTIPRTGTAGNRVLFSLSLICPVTGYKKARTRRALLPLLSPGT